VRISFRDVALGTDICWWWRDGEGFHDVSQTSIANAPSTPIANAPSFVTLSSS
jgi:hypothetical protein